MIFFIPGLPAPQGSKRGFYNKKTRRVHMVESSKNVKPWREAVKWTALEEDGTLKAGFERVEGPVDILLVFWLPRPKGHWGTGRNEGKLKLSAPPFPAVRPDIDKLARSTLDGLKDAGLYEDDSRVVFLRVEKRYAERQGTGCSVEIRQTALPKIR